jgi:single-strand DNA-binding protein
MAQELWGKLHFIKEIESFGTSNFQKREFVVVTDEQYPQHILLELHGDRVDLIDPYQIGEALKISINLRGREWVNPQGETRYFNSMVAWKIERQQTSQPPAPQTQQTAVPQTNTTFTHNDEEEPDDLPF